MMNIITSLLQIEVMITILVGLAAFATVLTIAAPYFENDKLGARIKGVSVERDKLRAAQKAQLMGGEARLREKPQKSLVGQIVETLNLKNVFEAEGSREMLRQAGMRNERHLVTFLGIRLASPFVLAIIAFVYSSTVFADRVAPNMRITVAMVALVVGFYLPNVVLRNLVKRRQDSIRRSWSDALDLLLICVESGMSIEPAMQRVAREIGSG